MELEPEVFNNTNPIDKFTVGDLTRVAAALFGDSHFVPQMSKMMSKQVAVILGKSIKATCLKCIEQLTQKIEKQSKLPVLIICYPEYLSLRETRRSNNNILVEPASALTMLIYLQTTEERSFTA